MWNQNSYDIIIVGGGPAGAIFAHRAATEGVNVLVLDKKERIGTPVRCGEAVAAEDFHKIVELQKKWIRTEIDKFCFIAPNNVRVNIDLNQTGYILNRKFFDADLVKNAESAGATVITNAYVNEVIIENDFVTGVSGVRNNVPFSVKSKIVIGADGVEGRIGRFAGIKSKLNKRDLIPGYEIVASNIEIDPNTCYFYVSNIISPGGYIWAFPHNANKANIGLGISAMFYEEGNSARERLGKFLSINFPDHKEESFTMGGIILARPSKQMISNGLMLIGDAARTVDPLTGGGIVWGMTSGAYAAEVAINTIKNNIEPSTDILVRYQKKWMQNEGKQAKRLYRFKEAVYGLSDDNLNKIAEKYNLLPANKKTILNLFKICFRQSPALILDVAKQFIGI